ncbi:calcium/proton exchanger, partial [Tanacetum coccineum]
MAKGQPKKKIAKKVVFTVYLKHDGIFTSWPLKYAQGDIKELNDTNFNEMSYEHLVEIIKWLVGSFEKVYYYQTGAKLSLGIREIKSDQDIADMKKFDRNEEQNNNRIESSDDDYYSSDDCEEIKNVDFQTEGDDSVVIKNISTEDPFLTKLCSTRVMFRGQKCVVYLAFDPYIPWDKMEPTLGITYETSHHLNLALSNSGVAYGFQLWFMKNDWRKVLVYCGRNVVEGRCAGKKGNKDRLMPSKVRTGFCKEIIEDPFMPLRKMRDDIRHKFMIDVSIGQCMREKQLALFDHEGRLIEHYRKLYQYRQALLDSNPGSTCILDVDESANRSATFKRMYNLFSRSKGGLVSRVRKIKQIDQKAYEWLIERNPNSRSRAFFEMVRRCAAFENGISESFNRAILENGFGFQELEVRKDDQSYGVSLQHKVCQCRMWELSGVPCVHVVAAYMHVGTDLDVGVGFWYSQESSFNAYRLSIKPVFGSNMWRRTNGVPPLPPLIRKMHGRPQEARIKAPFETSVSHVSRLGRTMTWKNCWQKGHNKASCKAKPQPKPIVEKKQPSRKKHVVVRQCASRGGGSSGRGDGNDGSSSRMGGRGQPKKKITKKVVFTVYLKHDGIFTSWPLKYAQGDIKELNDTNFNEMSYEHLVEIIKWLVGSFEKVYYSQTGAKLSLGIREIKSDQDIADMKKVGYDNGNEVDMFVEISWKWLSLIEMR